jgi:uncharacterized coiled-coil DUF342 family protein
MDILIEDHRAVNVATQVRQIAELIDELAAVKKERDELKEKLDQAASALLDVVQTLRSKTWSGV